MPLEEKHDEPENPEAQEDDEQNKFMSEFFAEVNAIKTGMALIRKNIKSIEENNSQYLNAVNVDQNTSNRKK